MMVFIYVLNQSWNYMIADSLRCVFVVLCILLDGCFKLLYVGAILKLH